MTSSQSSGGGDCARVPQPTGGANPAKTTQLGCTCKYTAFLPDQVILHLELYGEHLDIMGFVQRVLSHYGYNQAGRPRARVLGVQLEEEPH
jgi:hypothetical protein